MPWLLVVGGRVQGSRICVRDEGNFATDQSQNFPHPERIACCSAPNSRPPATKALHIIFGNNTIVVLISWWWAYKCPKHVEQIISAINHSVASSCFSSLRPVICWGWFQTVCSTPKKCTSEILTKIIKCGRPVTMQPAGTSSWTVGRSSGSFSLTRSNPGVGAWVLEFDVKKSSTDFWLRETSLSPSEYPHSKKESP